MTQQITDDEPRDAHLVAALRHAPDHEVTPPARVTAEILARAQQSVQAPKGGARAWRDSLRASFARLWQPAPMAAFGTLALATLIGVLWGGREWPDATPSLRPDQATAPMREDTPGASAAPERQARAAEATSVEAGSATSKSPPASKPAAPASATPPTRPGARHDSPQPRRAAPEAEARLAAQGAAAAALPQAAPPTASPSAIGDTAQAAYAAPPAPVQRDALAKSLADAAPAAARARSEAAAPSVSGSAQRIATPLAAAAAEIDAAAASDPSRVRWRVAPQRLVAHDAAQRDWWSALIRESSGHWQRGAAGAGSGAESAPITLLIDGAARGSIGFESQAVVWRDASGAMWRAPIAADTSRAWQEAVARW
jgi:hypothetical protein